MAYEVRPSFFGPSIVAYQCLGCGHDLESPLSEAGEMHPCPFCHQVIETPGTAELREEIRKAAEQKDRDDAERAAAERERVAKETARAMEQLRTETQAAAPPELVWYGEMVCNACGYRWQSRRDTPPAKCAGCSSRDIVPVRLPKRTGCLVAIVVAGAIAVLAAVLVNAA